MTRVASRGGLRHDPWATPQAALCTLEPGDEVNVTYETGDGWCRVRVTKGKHAGTEGYIYWAHLSPASAEPEPLFRWWYWLAPLFVIGGVILALYLI